MRCTPHAVRRMLHHSGYSVATAATVYNARPRRIVLGQTGRGLGFTLLLTGGAALLERDLIPVGVPTACQPCLIRRRCWALRGAAVHVACCSLHAEAATEPIRPTVFAIRRFSHNG